MSTRVANQEQPEAASPEQIKLLTEAKVRRKRIDKAIGVASFNAWSGAVMAALALPFALFSVSAALTGMVLTVFAYTEFSGRKMLRELEVRGLQVMAINQLALGAAIILYAVWQIVSSLTGGGQYAELIAQSPELGTMLRPMESMIRKLEVGTYAVVIVGTVAMQGGTALYYWTRRKHLKEYLEQTPEWAIQIQRAAA
jgi:hypothetical protein